jgi:hypothetical protein
MTSTLYRPLSGSEIRVVKIKPGDDNDDLVECELTYVDLDTRPVYFALSYVWGNPTVTNQIKLNGESYNITINLYLALRQLRGLTNHLGDADVSYIWADAICINQKDTAEKSTQVPRMGVIYKEARRVIGCLGGITLEEDSMIKNIFAKANEIGVRLSAQDSTQLVNYGLANELGNEYADFRDAFSKIVMRRWFGRMWIIQEVALPKISPIVFLGPYWTTFDNFYALWSSVVTEESRQGGSYTSFLIGSSSLPSFSSIRKQFHRYATQNPLSWDASMASSLLEILSIVGTFQATLPHDYIYAILGLTPMDTENIPRCLRPNYELPFSTVFHSYAAYIIRHSGDLRILNSIMGSRLSLGLSFLT